jgi:hypothetical protein
MEQRHEEDYTEFFNVVRQCIEQETRDRCDEIFYGRL